MNCGQSDGSVPDRTFTWMFETHVSNRVLVRYREGSLSSLELETLESHLVLCPVCQLQLGDLPLPRNGALVSCYA
jgi:hypothetical protein